MWWWPLQKSARGIRANSVILTPCFCRSAMNVGCSISSLLHTSADWRMGVWCVTEKSVPKREDNQRRKWEIGSFVDYVNPWYLSRLKQWNCKDVCALSASSSISQKSKVVAHLSSFSSWYFAIKKKMSRWFWHLHNRLIFNRSIRRSIIYINVIFSSLDVK